VVVDNDAVYVRSWLGERGWWYRHALERPDQVKLHVGGREVAVRAVHTTDADSIQRCTRALESKYSDSMSTAAMVAPKVLAFTMRLDPR